MNDTCSKPCLARLALLSVIEFLFVTGLVVALIFGLTRLAESRATRPLAAGADGPLVLPASRATLRGKLQLVPRVLEAQKSDFTPRYARSLAEERRSRTIGHWSHVSDSVAWRFQTPTAGNFDIAVECAAGPEDAGGEFELTVGDERLTAKVPARDGDNPWRTVPVGRVHLSTPGVYTLTLKPVTLAGKTLMDLKSVVLTRHP